MTFIFIAAAVVIVILIGLFIRSRRDRRPDGVDSFRRQIDALSPEARRPTIEKMNPSEMKPDSEDGSDGT